MDEDSILFQAIKNEMSPQIDQIAMRPADPYNQYPLGVEVRAKSPGGSLANPTRMMQSPSDFAGRPGGANENMRGPVIDRSGQFSEQRIQNMIRQAREEQALYGNPAPTSRGIMQRLKDFFNANRPPNSGLFD